MVFWRNIDLDIGFVSVDFGGGFAQVLEKATCARGKNIDYCFHY